MYVLWGGIIIHVCIMGWYYNTRMYYGGGIMIHVCIMGVL